MDNSLFTTEPFLTGKPLEVWLASMGVKGWSVNKDGSVDVAGHVALDGKLGLLTRLPVRFGTAHGSFRCSRNHLVSLEGAPRQVGGDFYCYNNQLVSLKGAPTEVAGNFSCRNNQLVSLEGAPEVIGYFDCTNNQLVRLGGVPKNVSGDFYCSSNQLESLEGAPEKVGGRFWCHHNLLVDFKGLEVTSIVGALHVTSYGIAGQDNVIVSLNG